MFSRLTQLKKPIADPALLDSRALGDHDRDMKKWKSASEHYKTYLDDNPDDFGILVQFANCCKESGDFELAQEAYGKAIEIDPRDVDVRVQYGHLMKVTGKMHEAIEAYGIAATLDPEHRDAKHERDALLAARSNSGSQMPYEKGTSLPQFRSLRDLSGYLKERPEQFAIFRSYFNEFIPS